MEIEPYYLYSIRQQASYSWRKILCELIDNSFDAEATRVDLHWPGGDVFRIEDNGKGTDDLSRMVKLGKRFEHANNDVGKYGVGCKHALIWLWGTSHITSSTGASAKEITMNWSEIADGNAPYPGVQTDCESTVPRGTRINCCAERGYPNFDELFSSLSATYTPGIEIGKQIVVHRPRRNSLALWQTPWPKTSEEITDTIEAAGRSVTVKMGIVADGNSNPYARGFAFERKYRVIKQSLLGTNGFAANQLAARVTLGKEWELSTNKDDFSEFEDELADAIYERFQHLMRKASEQAITIEESSFNQELAAIIHEAANETKREQRKGSENATGTVEPKQTGARRTRASKTTDQPGSVIDDGGDGLRKKKRGFQIGTYSDPDGLMSFGYYDESANKLQLNTLNPWLKEHHAKRNMDALLPVVMGIISQHEHQNENTKRPLFVGQPKDFSTRWGLTVLAAHERGMKV